MKNDQHPRNDSRLPLGAAVTVLPRLLPARDWTAEALDARNRVVMRAGEATGCVVAVHDSHGLCYDVRFANGVVACYDPDEVQPSNDCGEGVCGGCDQMLLLFPNPHGSVARCVSCRARDDQVAQLVERLRKLYDVPEAALAPLTAWLSQCFNWTADRLRGSTR